MDTRLAESAFLVGASRSFVGGLARSLVEVVTCAVEPRPELLFDGFWRYTDHFYFASAYWQELHGTLKHFVGGNAVVVAFGPKQVALVRLILGPSVRVVEGRQEESPWSRNEDGYEYSPRQVPISFYRDLARE